MHQISYKFGKNDKIAGRRSEDTALYVDDAIGIKNYLILKLQLHFPAES